jgi:hypothetical protein
MVLIFVPQASNFFNAFMSLIVLQFTAPSQCSPYTLKVLSSEMDPVEIRLVR